MTPPEIEQHKQEAWSFLHSSSNGKPHARVAAACTIVEMHFERSGRRGGDHPDFDRYARAYDAEQVFQAFPDVLPAFRAMYPKEPHPNLPPGMTVWRSCG